MGSLPKVGTRLELEIEDLAYGGRGVGRADGVVVMVERGLPGDRVVAEVFRRRRRHCEARRVEVLRPSPERRTAPCRHATTCGGCKLMELDDAAQLAAKSEQVRQALRRVGGLEGIEVTATRPSEHRLHYRNKMEFSFGRDAAGRPALGLHPPGRFDLVFQVEQCLLPAPAANPVLAFVVEAVRRADLPFWDVREHTGFLRFLVWREAKSTGQHMVNFVTAEGEAEAERLRGVAAELYERFPDVVSVLRNVNPRPASVAVGEREEVLAGAAHLEEEIDGLRFRIGANTFFQTNVWQAGALFRRLLERAALTGGESVVDLYCGVGTISLHLARSAAHVLGIEAVADSIHAARANAQLNRIDDVTFVCADARELAACSAGRPRPELVVVNPPRAGMHPRVVRDLVGLAPARIGYVSCDPITLSRDLGLLAAGGYRIEPVEPFDMFPQTPHVECLAFATREER